MVRFEQFSIILDNSPNYSYSPGDTVSGKVVITTSEENSTKGIKLEFVGRARVHWTETSGTGDDERTTSYGDTKKYFSFETLLFGDGEVQRIYPPGTMSCPFSYKIPMTKLPCNIKEAAGEVEYLVVLTFKRPFPHRNVTTQEEINVKSVFDLNLHPAGLEPGQWQTSKTFGCLCCISGPLSMMIRLNKTGFCPGELALVEVEVSNTSGTPINALSARIYREIHFLAHSATTSTRRHFNVVKETGLRRDEDVWQIELKIPDVPPTMLGTGCEIINVQYAVLVQAHVPAPSTNLYFMCPILIGNVPFR